jgi:hypothetical protein
MEDLTGSKLPASNCYYKSKIIEECGIFQLFG